MREDEDDWIEEEEFYDYCDYTKCWRCQQKAVLNNVCFACGEKQEED